MAINRAAIILIVCGVLVIAAILVATGVFLWLDRRRSRRIQQLTITSKGKGNTRDVDTIPEEVATTSMGQEPVTDVASTEEYHSEVHMMHHYPPQPPYRPRQGFSAYPTPPQSIQERGVEPSPPATPRVSTKASKAPQSIPWGRQAMIGRSDAGGRTPSDATGPPRTSIRWQTSRDRASPTSDRPTKAAYDHSHSSTTTARTRTTPKSKSALPSSQPSSAQTVSFDLHEFPLPPIPIVTTDPQSAPPVLELGTARERHRASTLYEPREYAYARRSFVQGGSWQNAAAPSGSGSGSGSGRPQPKPRRAATAPMDGFEALRLARKGSHLDIPLSAMGGGSMDMDSRRRQMQRERSA